MVEVTDMMHTDTEIVTDMMTMDMDTDDIIR